MKKEHAVKRILNSGDKFVISITGGGSEAIGEILRYGGGSACLIEAIVPYSQNSLASFLKKEPEKFCSKETACKMAAASLDIALKNSGTLGVGMTCSLSKENERNGREHWVHIALCTQHKTTSFSIQLNDKKPSFFNDFKNKSLRVKQEAEAAALLLMAIGSTLCEKSIKEFRVKTYESECVCIQEISNNDILKEISFEDEVIYPGSFNPCHDSHSEIMKAASKLTNKKVTVEISLTNVDKPRVDLIDVKKRIESFQYTYLNPENYFQPQTNVNVFLTEAPLFKDKVKLFKNATFIIGYDTYSRLDKSIRNGETSIEDLEGVKFLVFHRNGYEINKTSELSLLCEFVPHEIYYDTHARSSTKIRNGKI